MDSKRANKQKTIKVWEKTHRKLKDIKQRTGVPVVVTVHRAVEGLDREPRKDG